MPRTNGTYTAPANTVNPAVNGTPIVAADFNAMLDDIEDALSESVVGPASATDGRIATFDGATGKLLQDGGKTIAEVEAAAAASAVATLRDSVDAAYDTLSEIKTALDGIAASTSGTTVPDISGLPVLADSSLAATDKGVVYDDSGSDYKAFYIARGPIDPTNPEYGAAGDGVADDTAELLAAANAAVASGRALRLRPGLTFALSQINFPANLVIEAAGATIRADGTVTGNTAIVTMGANNRWDQLTVTTSATTSERIVQVSSGARFGRVFVRADSQIANSTDNFDAAVRLVGSDIVGDTVEVENFDYAIAIASTDGAGSPISGVHVSNYLVRNFVRGVYVRNAVAVTANFLSAVGASANATTSPGHNGLLTASVQDFALGMAYVVDCGEHAVRVGGKNGSEQNTKNVTIGNVVAIRPGQCGFKANCTSPERFTNINVGPVQVIDCAATSATGTNEDACRIEDVDGGTFGPVTALYSLKSQSCNDGIHIAHCNGVVVRPGSYIDKPLRAGVYLDEKSDATTGTLSNIHVGKVTVANSVGASVAISTPTTTIENIIIDCDSDTPGTYAWSITANAVTAPCILRGNSHAPGSGHYTGSTDADVIKAFTRDGGMGLLNNVEDQALTGGVRITSKGLSTGSITLDPGDRPIQHITNGGAFTITAPANDGYLTLLVTNNASAGAITFSGFQVSSDTGDPLTTTNGHDFMITVVRINAIATYHIKALQ